MNNFNKVIKERNLAFKPKISYRVNELQGSHEISKNNITLGEILNFSSDIEIQKNKFNYFLDSGIPVYMLGVVELSEHREEDLTYVYEISSNKFIRDLCKAQGKITVEGDFYVDEAFNTKNMIISVPYEDLVISKINYFLDQSFYNVYYTEDLNSFYWRSEVLSLNGVKNKNVKKVINLYSDFFSKPSLETLKAFKDFKLPARPFSDSSDQMKKLQKEFLKPILKKRIFEFETKINESGLSKKEINNIIKEYKNNHFRLIHKEDFEKLITSDYHLS